MSFDINQIQLDKALKIGADDAPVKVVEYINLRCPDSRDYELNLAPYLDSYIKEGKVQRIIKHFDKEIRELEKGNLMNQYLDYDNPTETTKIIHQLFLEQKDWASQRLAQMPHLALDYGLTLEANNRQRALEAMDEIKAVGVERIPTVFVNDQAFVETIEFDEFKEAVDSELSH